MHLSLSMASSGKKRKGGIRQRLQQQREDTAVTSELAAYLLEECFWGAMSPQQVQRIASLALRDARPSPDETGDAYQLRRLINKVIKLPNRPAKPKNWEISKT